MSASIHLGTQGWSYDDWKGVFYPPGSKQEDRLPFYASVFGWKPEQHDMGPMSYTEFHLDDKAVAGMMAIPDSMPA